MKTPRSIAGSSPFWRISLERFAESPIDMNRVVRMLLVHDIGEIDTGDTIFFAETGWEERKAAELNAVKRIFGLLPEDQAAEFLALWQEFEQAETTEALFAHAVDRAMPVLLNLANQGQSWRENGISYERVVHRIKPPIQAGCPALWEYLEGGWKRPAIKASSERETQIGSALADGYGVSQKSGRLKQFTSDCVLFRPQALAAWPGPLIG